jgi:hypothetical protein
LNAVSGLDGGEAILAADHFGAQGAAFFSAVTRPAISGSRGALSGFIKLLTSTIALAARLSRYAEVYIESFESHAPSALRPAINMPWNAFGFLRCDMYDTQGHWSGNT